MPNAFHTVNVFAEERYGGNPLAVFLDAGAMSDDEMQALARETNLSETTFVTANEPGPGGWPVRIYTPDYELPFAGHPTLGTAWVIREHVASGRPADIDLALGVGTVPVRFETDASSNPARPPDERPWFTAPTVSFGAEIPKPRIAPALGLSPADLDDRGPVQHVGAGIQQLFVPVRTREALQRAQLDLRAFAEAVPGFIAIVYLFANEPIDPANDFHARLFFDSGGVREDPATGSATALLGAYLLQHQFLGSSELTLRVEQGYAIHRKSLCRLTARDADGERTVRVGGSVIPAFRGQRL